jgi:uncharacterized protein YjbJ (UPF0337 family)
MPDAYEKSHQKCGQKFTFIASEIVFCRTKGPLIALHAGASLAPYPNYHLERRNFMNWDQVEGKWEQVKGKVKEQWGKLTDDDLMKIKGKRDQLRGKLQERYGYAKDQAEREIDEWSTRANY